MKLKLDLHPIFTDGRQIEASLQSIIDEACEKRADEIEIIPGKGSGALKKSVLRFLDRPEIKARYHRIEKDSDNWGRLFVHFRWDRSMNAKPSVKPAEMASVNCFCCDAAFEVKLDRDMIKSEGTQNSVKDCPSCGSPNNLKIWIVRDGSLRTKAESGYE